MVLNHGQINQYIDIITPAQDKSPMNMSLLCSSFNIHEIIIQEATSLWYSWGRPEGDAACRSCVCVCVLRPHKTHKPRQTACRDACSTLMTSPSWRGGWGIFHRLSSVAVERPPPILSPPSLMYTTRAPWMICDIASLSRSKDNIVWPFRTSPTPPSSPSVSPTNSLSASPHAPRCLMGVYGCLSRAVCEEYWFGLSWV